MPSVNVRTISDSDAPGGLKSVLDGDERLPISGGFVASVTGILNFILGRNNTFTGGNEFIPSANDVTGIYVQTKRDAYGLDVEQYDSDSDDLDSPNYFGYRESSGSGNLNAHFFEAAQFTTGSGTIVGDWIRLENNGYSDSDMVFQVDKNGSVNIPSGQTYKIGSTPLPYYVSVPANASATGIAGQISYDSDFLYICTGTNTWKKVAIATW